MANKSKADLGGIDMIGDKYKVKADCIANLRQLKEGDILIEKEAYNFEKECREDGGIYNELIHDEYGYICDVGSIFAKDNLERVE